MTEPSCVQWDAVAVLYARLVRVPPSSPQFKDIDHAIDLALNPGRSAPSSLLLARGSTRDARRIRHRRESKHLVVYLPDDFDDTHSSARPTPEEEVAAAEVEAHVRADLRRRGPGDADAFFDGMLRGDTSSLTLARGRVTQLRSYIRTVALRRLRDLAA